MLNGLPPAEQAVSQIRRTCHWSTGQLLQKNLRPTGVSDDTIQATYLYLAVRTCHSNADLTDEVFLPK